MGILVRDNRGDEEQPGGGGAGLEIDLVLKACPSCRREVPGWQDTCPDCGEVAVRKRDLPGVMAPPPAHLLEDDEGDDLDEDVLDEGDEGDDPVADRSEGSATERRRFLRRRSERR